MLHNLKNTNNSSLEVGIFGATANRSANGSKADNLAYRLKVNDLGLGHNPERSVLHPAIQDSLNNDPIVRNFLGKDLDNSSHIKGIDAAGLRMSANVQKHMVDLKSPAKLQSTIDQARRRYGGTRANPMIQTAETKNSVTFRYKK